MNLRLAQPADAAALARLGRESFVAKFGAMYAPDDLAAFLAQAYADAAVAAELARPDIVCCLADAGDSLAGYCKLALKCGWPEFTRGAGAIELKQLYTDPAMTGQGIGASLIDWAIGEARSHGADEIQLSVWSGNEGAQRFYARYGFVKVGETTFLVGNHVDEEFVFAALI